MIVLTQAALQAVLTQTLATLSLSVLLTGLVTQALKVFLVARNAHEKNLFPQVIQFAALGIGVLSMLGIQAVVTGSLANPTLDIAYTFLGLIAGMAASQNKQLLASTKQLVATFAPALAPVVDGAIGAAEGDLSNPLLTTESALLAALKAVQDAKTA